MLSGVVTECQELEEIILYYPKLYSQIHFAF